MIPAERGREKCDSGVFLTVPLRVAMKTKWASSNSRTGTTALMRSPSSSGSRLMIGRPREARLPWGSS